MIGGSLSVAMALNKAAFMFIGRTIACIICVHADASDLNMMQMVALDDSIHAAASGPQHDANDAMAIVSSEELTNDAAEDITYFAVVFAAKGKRKGAFKNDLVKSANLSLASAHNLGGRYSLVTHKSCDLLPELRAMEAVWPHVSVVVIPDEVLGTTKSWVVFVDALKQAFLRRNMGQRVVYVELDQLFAPGTGAQLSGLYTKYKFDVALAYKDPPDRYGAVNTGIIAMRVSDKVLVLFQEVMEETDKLCGKGCSGGENQIAFDHFVPPVKPGSTTQSKNGAVVFGFKWDGPLNRNVGDCCEVPSGTYVAHFKSSKKPGVRSQCCRDFVNVHPEAWAHECKCAVKYPRAECWAKNDTNSAAVEWCSTK